jgi:hypothetical protein
MCGLPAVLATSARSAVVATRVCEALVCEIPPPSIGIDERGESGPRDTDVRRDIADESTELF